MFGGLKRTLLNALKNSERNWRLTVSVKAKLLNREMSQFQKPGAERMSRPEVPKVSGAVRLNAFGLNQYSDRLALPKSWPGWVVFPPLLKSELDGMPLKSAR